MITVALEPLVIYAAPCPNCGFATCAESVEYFTLRDLEVTCDQCGTRFAVKPPEQKRGNHCEN